MDEIARELDRIASLQQMLGYLNFSEGRPDPRFQKALSDAYGYLNGQSVPAPWFLNRSLRTKLAELKESGAAAFKDTAQAEAVLPLAFDRVLPAYQAHHADLLFHQGADDLFQPFFLARVFEAILSLGPTREREEDVVRGTLARLNDYVGHRPVAILETRPRGEPYDHERVRPIPLFIRGTGVAAGKYQPLLARALDILQQTDPDVLREGGFDPEQLDELAMDPRAYDHGHPANKRPNYVFGEWDPHQIDSKGRYRRFVVRQLTLDALLDRADRARDLSLEEATAEASCVLAGTILMAAAVSGWGPEAHDSSASLAVLIPRIAACRDRFYALLIEKVEGEHGDRLRREAALTRQPFGGARQHLNQFLARHRAAQLQQRHFALVLAAMGYPEASRRQAARIPSAAVRLLTEIHHRLTTGQLRADAGDPAAAAALLPEVEDLLHRGIACGALADPWNVLGFQGLYPLSSAPEDSVRDQRIDELVGAVEATFHLYARLISEAAAVGQPALGEKLSADLKRLAEWWDRFATVEVSDVRRVHGAEVVASSAHVATALARWRERDQAAADLAFWRQHLEGFRSPKAFALVIEALLRKEDYRASMGLLMSWLSQVEQVPLEDGEHSFHALALRWMLGLCRLAARQREGGEPPPFVPWDLARRFFDHLEANAEEYWQVPKLDVAGTGEDDDEEGEGGPREEEEQLYGAAYENVTYEDSTDDDVEGEVLEVGPQRDFDLDEESKRLDRRLRFLATVARLWNVASRLTREPLPEGADAPAVMGGWLARARQNYQGLLALLDAVHDHPIPDPSGATDSLVEYDQRREVKDRLTHTAIETCLDTAMTVGGLLGRLDSMHHDGAGGQPLRLASGGPRWEACIIRLEQALWRGDTDEARTLVPAFLDLFKEEPLLYVPLSHGGHPRHILRAAIAQTILRALAANLPRVGLLPEAFKVLRSAHAMEMAQPPQGHRVTEFARLFQLAMQASVEALADSADAGGAVGAALLLPLLERLAQPFMALWGEHSNTSIVASLETVQTVQEWTALRDFIRRYGRDLFHVRFMTYGNLRGILHRGVGAYLDSLRDEPDPLHPVKLAEELDRDIPRARAEHHLNTILRTLLENYEEFKDFNATSPLSDYGENLHILLDFLRLKAGYDRHAWRVRPLTLVHEVLARRRSPAAELWAEQITRLTHGEAERHLQRLGQLEKAHGIRLRTVSDRLQERFVAPLALDRLCALVEPAMDAAGTPEADDALAELEQEAQPYLDNPTGVGLDLPHWLHRVEAAVHQVQGSRTVIATLAENLFKIPTVTVPVEDLRRQLDEWGTWMDRP